MGNVALKLQEVYDWWAGEIDKPVGDFDEQDKKLAVEAYMEKFQKAISGSTVKNSKADLAKKRGREIRKGRRGGRPF
jgi:hypothetical protein